MKLNEAGTGAGTDTTPDDGSVPAPLHDEREPVRLVGQLQAAVEEPEAHLEAAPADLLRPRQGRLVVEQILGIARDPRQAVRVGLRLVYEARLDSETRRLEGVGWICLKPELRVVDVTPVDELDAAQASELVDRPEQASRVSHRRVVPRPRAAARREEPRVGSIRVMAERVAACRLEAFAGPASDAPVMGVTAGKGTKELERPERSAAGWKVASARSQLADEHFRPAIGGLYRRVARANQRAVVVRCIGRAPPVALLSATDRLGGEPATLVGLVPYRPEPHLRQASEGPRVTASGCRGEQPELLEIRKPRAVPALSLSGPARCMTGDRDEHSDSLRRRTAHEIVIRPKSGVGSGISGVEAGRLARGLAAGRDRVPPERYPDGVDAETLKLLERRLARAWIRADQVRAVFEYRPLSPAGGGGGCAHRAQRQD